MKKILLFIICTLSLVLICSCSGAKKAGTVYAQITMENDRTITLRLDGDTAPITVGNFVKLTEEKVYDGTIFHRVIKDFMIQGGDPTGTGSGDDSIPKIKGEFSANGVKNSITHKRGVISMARSSNSKNSASSQFFICHADSPHLDGKYAAFGYVIAGMDTVDAIASVPTNANDRPVKEQKMKSVRIIDEASANAAVEAEKNPTDKEQPALLSGKHYVGITMEDGGKIVLELDADTAPITVTNFISLVNAGTYNGLIFHRVVAGSLIQGGDPAGTGSGDGSIPTIKGEFSANGIQNNISHVRGVISMARLSTDTNSATSQFFICQSDLSYLDGQYAAFGRVIAGMSTVDKIAEVSTDYYGKPTEDQKMQSVVILTKEQADAEVEADKNAQTDPDLLSGKHYVRITMEGGSSITLELDADAAPITVTNFIKHVRAGTYNGTIFHRVMQNFMIQGGDPTGTGYGDSSIPTIKGEFASNGIQNSISHVRGVISMARTDLPNSASTQFFICHVDYPSLDGNYAAFGRVIAGMSTVDAIATVPTNSSNRPTIEQKMQSVVVLTKEEADADIAKEKAESNT